MTNEQLEELQNIRNAVDNMYEKLNIDLYEKKLAAKVSYTKVNPSNLIIDQLEYIAQKLNLIQEAGE